MNLGSFGMLLPFFRTSWCVGVLNSAIFNSFHNLVEFGAILKGLQNFGGVEHPKTPLGTPLVGGEHRTYFVQGTKINKDSNGPWPPQSEKPA